jgi:hypothetical protein
VAQGAYIKGGYAVVRWCGGAVVFLGHTTTVKILDSGIHQYNTFYSD